MATVEVKQEDGDWLPKNTFIADGNRIEQSELSGNSSPAAIVVTPPTKQELLIGGSSKELHDSGKCKPCTRFARKGGCDRGSSCIFCHLCPPEVFDAQKVAMKARLTLARKNFKKEKGAMKAQEVAAEMFTGAEDSMSEDDRSDSNSEDDAPGDDDGSKELPDDCVTVMIKNVPYKAGEAELKEAIKNKGFGGHNYWRMPCDAKKKKWTKDHHSMGFAFIGFGTPEETKQFKAAFTGYVFANHWLPSGGAIAVVPAKHQGGDSRNVSQKKRDKRAKAQAKRENATNEELNEERNEQFFAERRSAGEKRGREEDIVGRGLKRIRISLDAPLSVEELMSLDSNGNSKPCWLAPVLL